MSDMYRRDKRYVWSGEREREREGGKQDRRTSPNFSSSKWGGREGGREVRHTFTTRYLTTKRRIISCLERRRGREGGGEGGVGSESRQSGKQACREGEEEDGGMRWDESQCRREGWGWI